ncbi:hypothetical protein RBB50_012335 [Rhinocladiella similis]
MSGAELLGALVFCSGIAAVIASPFALLIWKDSKNQQQYHDRRYAHLERIALIKSQRWNESGLQEMDYSQLEDIAAAVTTEIRRRNELAEARLWYTMELNEMRNWAEMRTMMPEQH